MPTISITTDPLPVPRRRAIAVRLTRWLSKHGTVPAHVVVHFSEHTQNSLFTGGMPVEALVGGPTNLRHASVTCCVAPDRDERFCDLLAEELADALGADAQTAFLYIEFRFTSPDHVYLWRANALHRAGQLAAARSGKDSQ